MKWLKQFGIEADEPIRRPTGMSLAVSAELHHGLGGLQGMLYFDGRELRVDFQTSDALFGLIQSRAKSLIVPLAAIDSVHARRGFCWVMPYLDIKLNDFKLLTKMPGSDGGRWALSVRWRDRGEMRRMVSAIAFARAQWLHEQLSADLPPIPPMGVPMPPATDSVAATPRQRNFE